ncbi:MAG: histidine kinase [Betaproteobacteria bacterium]|nr:histidine kinase [Betaproteobacteria bacterium]
MSMRTAFFFFFRRLFAWGVLFLLLAGLWSSISHNAPPWLFGPASMLAFIYVVIASASHLRRVRLISDHVNSETLANRQRRAIEIPLEANEAYAIVDAAIRELPHVQEVESAKDSLQTRAKVKRVDPYGTALPLVEHAERRLGIARNQVFATVAPREGTASVTLVCEPEGRAWCDWFIVGDATNLENANALTRAISRRIAEKRKLETESVKDSATQKELAVAKLGLLHAQVEPHFLYNTLGSAKYLIQSDPVKAEAMIDNLIAYLRNSLPRTESNAASTLGAEVERARAYLDILQIRMGARLTPHLDVPPALHVIPFPTMMLQTLVENAIKHGLEPKPGGGNIWVIARESAGILSVTVADDGLGLQSGSPSTQGTGIGLKNIRERLALAYGSEATFTFTANFPTGVAATLAVPVGGPKETPHE